MPTQHVWNRRMTQVPSSMSWHVEYATVRTASKRGSEALGKAATKPGHLWADAHCTLPPSPKSTHTFVWEQQHWLRDCVCSGGQRFWRWGSVSSGRHTDQAMHREYQQLFWSSVVFSSWLGSMEQLWVSWAFEELCDPNKQTLILLLLSINYILLEIKPRLFLRELVFSYMPSILIANTTQR